MWQYWAIPRTILFLAFSTSFWRNWYPLFGGVGESWQVLWCSWITGSNWWSENQSASLSPGDSRRMMRLATWMGNPHRKHPHGWQQWHVFWPFFVPLLLILLDPCFTPEKKSQKSLYKFNLNPNLQWPWMTLVDQDLIYINLNWFKANLAAFPY